MLKYGLIHGVVFVLIMLGLSFLLAWVELSDNVFEVVYMVALFAPLMIVGYRYKAKIGVSLLSVLNETKGKVLFYPFGVAIFTGALSLIGTHFELEVVSNDLGVGMLAFVYCITVIGHTLKMAVAIWLGSWFKKLKL